MALQGTLDTFALPDVLRLLAATKKTGRLRITGARGTGSASVLDGSVAAITADHAPHATELVDALFELLRFEEGSFAFDADVAAEAGGSLTEVDDLLTQAEALLDEWRQIEAVVPSLDAFVTMRRILEGPAVSIGQEQWTALVAVGGGATVRRIADELCLAEIPVSRAVKELVELGVVDIEAKGSVEDTPAPAVAEPSPVVEPMVDTDADVPDAASALETDDPDGTSAASDTTAATEPAAAAPEPAVDAPPGDDEALPAARPLRARRTKAPAPVDDGPREPERFVSIELPGNMTSGLKTTVAETSGAGDDDAIDDLAAAFPGLANRTAPPSPEDEDLARQLATLSPRAAEAVRAAAEAATDEERDAALDEAEDGEDAPINRGLLLKFLSSVKS